MRISRIITIYNHDNVHSLTRYNMDSVTPYLYGETDDEISKVPIHYKNYLYFFRGRGSLHPKSQLLPSPLPKNALISLSSSPPPPPPPKLQEIFPKPLEPAENPEVYIRLSGCSSSQYKTLIGAFGILHIHGWLRFKKKKCQY